MTTIDKIDFSKLKPYDGKVTKCFEQFCYQVAQKEFGHLGFFTPIEGSGGDGGVEFYLNLKNGEKWGWQCKFFSDTGRLNVSNRKNQIEKSLDAACRNHTDLSKWILCLKTDLTENSIAPNGITSKGEQDWFRNQLPTKIPKLSNVSLEHWGESKFLELLNSDKHIGIKSFFFGKLEFSKEWFNKKYSENFEKVREKYDPDLHSIDNYTQSKIDFLLFDSNCCKQIDLFKRELFAKATEIENALKIIRDEKLISKEDKEQQNNFVLHCKNFKDHISFVYEKLDFLHNCFSNYSEDLLLSFDFNTIKEDFFKHFNEIDSLLFNANSRLKKESSEVTYLISEFGHLCNQFFENYSQGTQKELNFLGNAAKGKTHITCDIAYNRIKMEKPVIFITGEKFSEETNLSTALLRILDINQEFTLDDFIQALDIYGAILKCKVPIVIDGLNETTFNRNFSSIWKNHLSNFISKISQTKNLIVITTCRISYSKRIWSETRDKRFHFLGGFEDYETLHEAVHKYFKKYKLKADLSFTSLDRFEDPIFLKIFCENKNPSGKSINEVEVNIESESLFEVFSEYLNQVNKRVTQMNHLLRLDDSFIFESLAKLSVYIWDNNLREIPTKDFYKIIDGDKPYEKDNSKAEILINEGLVFTRDTRDKKEFVSFTYDILAGYMISENLIQTNQDLKYFLSNRFINKISSEIRHPLHEDILTTLCQLLPQLKQICFHDLIIANRKLFGSKILNYLCKLIPILVSKRLLFTDSIYTKSLNSLFSLPAKSIKKSDIELLKKYFAASIQNKYLIFELSLKTLSDIQHPLNSLFLSTLLESLPMDQRDVSWTEFVRKSSYNFERFIERFEIQCQSILDESNIITQKQHILAKIVLWFLTSTHRNLRDKSTRALYYYGRKFPKEFSDLVFDSLKINDPYVWERALAAMYGVTMAEHHSFVSNNFVNNILSNIGKEIYRLIFKEHAPYSTTHILARDYARRIIEICIIHHPNVLTQNEIKNIRPPYLFGGIRDLGEFDYGENHFDFSGPIHMDFSNYTIGSIVKDGSGYSNPPEKIKVRRQIYWRIFNLGWNAEIFKKAEKTLGIDDNYYVSRTERSKIERYGKKYSWIAFYENAGFRADLGLLDKQDHRFRISDADIDPSFPSKPKQAKFIMKDLLEDRLTPLEDWIKQDDIPSIENYLSMNNIEGNNGGWICLDGLINQEDVSAERRIFTFIRSFLIQENEYSEVIDLLERQELGDIRLSPKHENHYCFAGELYYCEEATISNFTTLESIISRKKIKKGDPNYPQQVIFYFNGDKIDLSNNFSDEIGSELLEIKKFEVLMPVMEYNWEGYHCQLNDAGSITVICKEIANYLNLIDQPQTFELYDSNQNKASINIYHPGDFNNNHSLIFLRKDLLDKFLIEKKFKLVWVIWGERQVTYNTNVRRHELSTTHPFKDYKIFKKVVDYKKDSK